MPERRGAFCSEVSLQNAESLAGTASRVDHWILVEYRGLWGHDALPASGLSDEVKGRLREQRDARPNTKLLFVRRPHRREHPVLALFWGSSPGRGGELFRAEVEQYDDLLGLDLTGRGAPLDHPLLLVCTHGKHDRCCARHGRPLYQALEEQAEDGWVWQASHLGGDRFAGNVVVLPDGLYFGRVAPADAWSVLDEYLAGRIDLDHYRGRSAHTFAEQAAEIELRRTADLRGLGDLELVENDGADISFRAGSRIFDLRVAHEPGELTYLTCSAETLRHPRHYAAEILRESVA
ncbi:MAG: sucrase ferredoxin [Verrucomicrobiota bacterium]